MNNLNSATLMMARGCYKTSEGFRQAYYSMPVKAKDKKCLKFTWKGNLYMHPKWFE